MIEATGRATQDWVCRLPRRFEMGAMCLVLQSRVCRVTCVTTRSYISHLDACLTRTARQVHGASWPPLSVRRSSSRSMRG
jgi:hypothetical protein